MTQKAMLIILDGYGINPETQGNAITQAHTPYLDELFQTYPHTHLVSNGRDVGLPIGIMGNSEVGHLNIGAGRIVNQLNTLIDVKIESGEFFQNDALLSAIHHAKKHRSKIHLFGLLSDGGVHSSLNHLEALLQLCKNENFFDVYYHAFMDGRDSLEDQGITFMQNHLKNVEKYQCGRVASISGRYYAMDRDNNWDRVERAYQMLVEGKGQMETDPLLAIKHSYEQKKFDEFILPIVIHENGKPLATICDDDAIIFFNFRSDRTREITRSFIYEDFTEFPVKKIKNLKYVTMVEYDIHFTPYVSVAFRSEKLENILASVIANHSCKQLRLAETEKYAHVTFFFNGGVEAPYENEDRILIPSPKVATYDMQPEMSAYLVTDKLKEIFASDSAKYDLIIVNYANCDMVGHTGIFDKVKIAVETVDKCLAMVVPLAIERGYHIIITADHGNAEQMLDINGKVMTAHSMNPVPFMVIHNAQKNISLSDGKLGDIAPTLLYLMDIPVPTQMSGKNLIN
jgi:2,3-bisphosphoglycerate-independent phosphoglycerate mutase